MPRRGSSRIRRAPAQVPESGWAIIVHPNVMVRRQEWARLGDRLCIENMDKRKPIGQTASNLITIFKDLPDATFCFDIGHARQVDPTMSEASSILQSLGGRMRQLHVSEVNTQTLSSRPKQIVAKR